MRLINADMLNFEGQHYNKSQMKAILDFIDMQPTAYDVDKTLEQLEDLKKEKDIGIHKVMIKDAIKIVKAGGN